MNVKVFAEALVIEKFKVVVEDLSCIKLRTTIVVDVRV